METSVSLFANEDEFRSENQKALLNKAFESGIKAAKKGKDRSSCPSFTQWAMSSLLKSRWRRGFDSVAS